MDAARTSIENIPREMVEEIVLHLPLKSLGLFACVSKACNSIIFNLDFIKRHRQHAALPGREMLITNPSSLSITECILTNLSRRFLKYLHQSTIVSPIQGDPSYVHAWCDGLLCVGVDNSLFLWNPVIKTYRKLPPMQQFQPYFAEFVDKFICGLGYDTVANDYKLLVIPRTSDHKLETELYSLKSNSWRKIPPSPFSKSVTCERQRCAFVNGALHWVDHPTLIVSFNLSSDKYVQLAAPKYDRNVVPNRVEVSVLTGKLCATQLYWTSKKFLLWLMDLEDCTWQKMVMVDYGPNGSVPFNGDEYTVKPIHVYDSGNILVYAASSDLKSASTYLYKREDNLLYILVWEIGSIFTKDAYIYFESLVSPDSWPLLQQTH